MNEQLKLKLKSDLKTELMNYYDKLKFNVDIKSQEDLKDDKINEEDKTKLIEENIHLVEQIDRVCDSNLSDINDYFENKFDNEIDLLISSSQRKFKTKKGQRFSESNQNVLENESELKKEIKKMALKSYLICIQHLSHRRYGLHCEFDWFVDENHLKRKMTYVPYLK